MPKFLEKHKIIMDNKEEIIKLYNDGTPIRQIAHEYNLAFGQFGII